MNRSIKLYGVEHTLATVDIEYKSFQFSAGEKQVRLPDLRSFERVIIEAFYPTDEQIFEIALIKNAIRTASELPVTISLPYLPYSRQDRACHPGEAFALEVLLNVLNLHHKNGDKILTWDVHSKVAVAVNNRLGSPNSFKNVRAGFFIRKYLQQRPGELGPNTLVVAPDQGAKERAELVHQEFGSKYPILYAEKVRDPYDGSITQTKLSLEGDQVIAADTILIVDDICDGGRTFIELAKVIRNQLYCESITLYVTHALFSKGFDVFVQDGKCLIERVISPNFLNAVPHDTQTEFVAIQ